MSQSSFGPWRVAGTALCALIWIQACSSSDMNARPSASVGTTGSGGNGGTNVVTPDTGGMTAEGGMGGYNAACGVQVKGCVPDAPLACADFVPAQTLELSAGGAIGADGQAGNWGQAGWAGQGGEIGDGGAGGTGGNRGEGGAAGGLNAGAAGDSSIGGPSGGAGGVPGTPEYACRVSSGKAGPVAACALSGSGRFDEPCFSGADCAAGLECVRVSAVARCRPYCCTGESSCNSFPGSYCTDLPLAVQGSGGRGTVSVPVCAQAERCDLSEPFPCPEGRVCQCSAGTACSVVRNDGTTACVTPGVGKTGEECPCSPGHVCSQSAMTCLKLCTIESAADAAFGCGTGKCQASAELPRGYGVCVDLK
ncbi:MAG TPA: hypothetical protein VFQ61_39495 [Polyangiaceae bacterium]|nr:hypothetical protein [Polyangiaceae bacterium]